MATQSGRSTFVPARPVKEDRTLSEGLIETIEDARFYFTRKRMKAWGKAVVFAAIVSMISSWVAYTVGHVDGFYRGRAVGIWLKTHEAELREGIVPEGGPPR